MISRRQALFEMRRKDEKGKLVPFSVWLVLCNRIKNTGGQLVTYKDLTLPKSEAFAISKTDRTNPRTKSPDHMRNGTINFLFPSGEFRKVHVGLITRFNGMKVI